MKNYLTAVQLLLGLIAAACTFELDHLADSPLFFGLMPGMVVAMAVTRNVHAWPEWLAALSNFSFYFFLTWLVAAIWKKVRRKSS
jgi:hypothetical protein